MNTQGANGRGVTLVEVVVMAAIVGVLMGMLMPAFARAREKSRRAMCMNNLMRVSRALDSFGSEKRKRPAWLSNLCPTYLPDSLVLLCPADESLGRDGAIPNRAPFVDVGAPQYQEADDTPACRARDSVRALRNEAVDACSYLYDFNLAECSWWTGGSYPDQNADGVVSWREVREEVDMKGLQSDGSYAAEKAFGGRAPIVRCFHHVRKRFDGSAPVLNLAVEDRNVYISGPYKDDWKTVGRTR